MSSSPSHTQYFSMYGKMLKSSFAEIIPLTWASGSGQASLLSDPESSRGAPCGADCGGGNPVSILSLPGTCLWLWEAWHGWRGWWPQCPLFLDMAGGILGPQFHFCEKNNFPQVPRHFFPPNLINGFLFLFLTLAECNISEVYSNPLENFQELLEPPVIIHWKQEFLSLAKGHMTKGQSSVWCNLHAHTCQHLLHILGCFTRLLLLFSRSVLSDSVTPWTAIHQVPSPSASPELAQTHIH